MTKEFSINDKGYFVIKDYQKKSTFASFLPGIAGKLGIPIWAFYVNRGQGIASFGLKSKDNSIMEFYPANKSYANVSTKGFRTFIKVNGEFYEPFREVNESITSEMIIAPDSLTLVENNKKLNIQTKVLYYILPNENFAGFVRKVEVTNMSNFTKTFKILDGMPILVPYGIDHKTLKYESQTITAWAKVYNLDNDIPFYRLSASASDEAQVNEIHSGNFYVALTDQSDKLLSPIVDPRLVFGYDNSLNKPIGFIDNTLDTFDSQITENQFPCAMSLIKKTLKSNESIVLNSMFGNVESEEILVTIKNKVLEDNYFDRKYEEMKDIHQFYSDLSFTHSGDDRFNGYVKQNFLDNILRGGIPVEIGEKEKKIYHIFSRKHGDLERDYNKFSLEPRYFSQGNGNFRDVNQNRRSDLFFNPNVKKHNLKNFFDLISLEGFNPLVINGQKFIVKDLEKFKKNVMGLNNKCIDTISKPYSLGELFESFELNTEMSRQEMPIMANTIIDYSESILVSSFSEGCWVDHWTYNLDLIENYLRIFPDKLEELFLEEEFRFYESYVKVLPRHKKYQLTSRGPRQYESLYEDEVKKELIQKRSSDEAFIRVNNKVYTSNLVVKIFVLLLNKISSLDSYGLGVEMEANKPGWYDALNGLPGLFGSSFGETAEVLKWNQFMQSIFENLEFDSIEVLGEVNEFYQKVDFSLTKWQKEKNNFEYWDSSTKAKEDYREKTFNKIKGDTVEISKAELVEFFEKMKEKLLYAFENSKNEEGLYNMFYSYEAKTFEETGEVSKQGLSFVNIEAFEKKPLSNFLEGQVKALKVIDSKKNALELHKKVLSSDLFDKKLKMFRVNGILKDESFEIGRAKAFSPGWLENGSIWLHMEYKYLLELLKSGLNETFIKSFKDAGVLYQSPEVYKRSIFENSSFILSSLSNDSDNHGRGYIARLSGATAEFIDIWTRMSFGNKPFKFIDDILVFQPEPVLTRDLFTKIESEMNIQLSKHKMQIQLPKDTFSSRFLGSTLIIYYNPSLKDTFGETGVSAKCFELIYNDGKKCTVTGNKIIGEKAYDLRNGLIRQIDIILN
jgi:hypothetical protein